MEDDFDIYNQELSEEEIEVLNQIAKKRRIRKIIIIASIIIALLVFIIFSAVALSVADTQEDLTTQIVEQYPFD